MPITNDNPYSAPQVLPEKRTSLLWQSLFYRTGIGFLVGVAVFLLVQLIGSSEKNGSDLLLLSWCVIVAATSTFTQSESAKQSGRTGIIAAILLCIISALVGNWIFYIFGLAPPRTSGYDHGTHEEAVQRFILWVFLYFVLISGYYLAYCRTRARSLGADEPEEKLP